MAVTFLEILTYIGVFAVLRLVYYRLADGGRDRPMAFVVIGAGIVIAGLILSGIDWQAVGENWRDIVANALVAAAIVSVIYGYFSLVGAARKRNADRGDDDRDRR